ncbi:DUF2515 family protein [Cohnella thermotolerans]|uniref:DUF2515 family protein n=1 Tax=Cohnella thermotolerans TaxID=329858 RepID=UPI00042A38B4|nr:DUF2515 family protein [Cohnella thermotolerans]
MSATGTGEGTNWRQLTKALAKGWAAKASGLRGSWRLSVPREPLRIRRTTVAGAEAALKQRRQRGSRGASSILNAGNAELVARIREETERLNRNNVTRTAGYWNLYRAYPELHWALLAHLVSRNGGWSMTDLRGEWLPRLLDASAAEELFRMLESCNALIFRDAYPQLKLYAESRRSGNSRFALLPAFGVSAFMAPFWERFWIDRDSATLTVALIVNEQHVVEHKVVQDPTYRDGVLRSAALMGQRALQLNQIVFPLAAPVPGGGAETTPLAGRVLERFGDLRERIAFGKSLYALLYAYPKVRQGALAFAEATPHSGSRADYWPGTFFAEPAERKTGGQPGNPGRAAGGEAIERWFSPRLEKAWDDRPLGPVREEDWLDAYGEPSALRFMRGLRPPLVFDMTREHEFGQRKLQAAVMAKAALLPGN